jgi:hypothetical protein
MSDKISIPENHIAFCRAIARLCREHKMRRVGVNYSPGFDDAWGGDIAMSWEQGRHGEDAGKLSISSNVMAHVRLDDPKAN